MSNLKNILILSVLMMPSWIHAQEWQMAGDNIRTEWAESVNPENVLPEYPRPQMRRGGWKSLNGLWDYAITSAAAVLPEKMDGRILVPFAVESALSGVGRMVKPSEALWYSTTFYVQKDWSGKRIMLNFGAVDWKAEVYVNDILIGSHTGGYTEFAFDITPYLNAKGSQKLTVKVTDETDAAGTFQPRGKQVSKPKGIWYTQVTGIWQSVWLEAVPDGSISSYYAVSDISSGAITLNTEVKRGLEGDIIVAELLKGSIGYDTEKPSSKVMATARAAAGNPLTLNVHDAKLWSPDFPYLYGLKISLVRNGKVIDSVDGYTAVREISTTQDKWGHLRMTLNGIPLFQFGPLDQGWWPDGLYTAPCDEALKYDILKTKELGFNMIRKHIKVEPARWYFHCDQAGMLVWQDMPCITDNRTGKWDYSETGRGSDSVIPEKWQENYYKEWKEIIDARRSFQCIVVWVPFNEAWGQFRTEDAAAFTKSEDSTRLVNSASGGNFRKCGDILDMHHYPHPAIWLNESGMVSVLGEYGGIGFPAEGHLWQKDKNWGYVKYTSGKEVTDKYIEYAEQLMDLIEKGCSAAVYTQTTDVEGEVNGFMTYDRKVMKMDVSRVSEINKKVISSLK